MTLRRRLRRFAIRVVTAAMTPPVLRRAGIRLAAWMRRMAE